MSAGAAPGRATHGTERKSEISRPAIHTHGQRFPTLSCKGRDIRNQTPKAVGERRVHLPIDLMACCKEAKKGEAQVAKCGRAGSGRSHRADPELCDPPVRS